MTGVTSKRFDLAATVTNREGAAVGRLNGVIVERDSRQIAGFHLLTDELAPREVFVLVGQVEHFEPDRFELTLTDAEVVALPDAQQHFFVAPQQEIEEEIIDAESGRASANHPDSDEQPTFSVIPGIALTPNLLIPTEVERAIVDDEQVVFRSGMRVLTATGEEVGHLAGFIVDEEARLVALDLHGDNERQIDYTELDTLDDDSNEVTLLAEGASDADATI
jgi:hypothetical protein